MLGFIFDLDGTLLDSLEDLKNSLNTVLERFNLPQHNSAAYKQFVGSGMKALVERALPKDYPDGQLVLNEFLTEYEKRYYEQSQPYDGIISMLEKLQERNIPFSICTNKKQEYTDEIVKRFFTDFDFVAVVGDRSDGKTKPDPYYPLLIAKAMKMDSQNIYFVGDSDVDMLTANNAGMEGIGVAWGFREVEELKKAGASLIIQEPKDIENLLD